MMTTYKSWSILLDVLKRKDFYWAHPVEGECERCISHVVMVGLVNSMSITILELFDARLLRIYDNYEEKPIWSPGGMLIASTNNYKIAITWKGLWWLFRYKKGLVE